MAKTKSPFNEGKMIKVIQLKMVNHDNFIYVIADYEKNQALVVDPAWDGTRIKQVLKQENLQLNGILLTHSHYDHINAVDDLLTKQTPLYLHQQEKQLWQDCPNQAILLQNNDQIPFGKHTIKVIHTKGHTQGSVCYKINNHLITGDTLFIYGCGRCDFVSSDVVSLYYSLQLLKSLPNEMQIWAGHDYGILKTDTLQNQKQKNPFLMIDNQADFIAYRQNLNSRFRTIPYKPMNIIELKQQLNQK